MERVIDADLSYPILIHPTGWLMDGYHRVARALMEGRKTLPAVQFTDDTLPPGNIRRAH
jgi:ParB-like chromosome segregation protein Spo0J